MRGYHQFSVRGRTQATLMATRQVRVGQTALAALRVIVETFTVAGAAPDERLCRIPELPIPTAPLRCPDICKGRLQERQPELFFLQRLFR